MLRHHLRLAVRLLKQNRLYTLIQLLGLAASITTSLLLLRYVGDEWAFDRYHQQADRIFRLTTRVVTPDTDDHVAFSLFVVAPRVQEAYPEVENYVRILPGYHKKAVHYRSKRFKEAHVYAADASVFSLFTYPLVAGNPLTVLAQPGSMVVSQSFARKYFGKEAPLGKTLQVDNQPYQITGLMQDVPAQSDLYVEALLSLEDPQSEMDEWSYTFLLLKPGASAQALEKKLAKFAEEPLFDSYDEDATNLKASYSLEPLAQVHFLPGRLYDQPKGNKTYLCLFSVLAVLLLAVAGINAANLSLAQSLGRSREAGLRKVLGATRRQIRLQAAGETGLLLLGALLLAGLLSLLLLPFFNQLAGKGFTFTTLLFSPSLGILFILLLALAVLLSGYQAFHLNQSDPVKVLKGNPLQSRQGIGTLLVVFQFMAAVTLMSGTLIVASQLRFLQQRDLGLQPARVVVIPLPGTEAVKQRVQAFTQRLTGSSLTEAVSLCDTGGEPGSFLNKDLFLVEQDDRMEEKAVTNFSCDAGYLPLLEINLRTGRNFAHDRPADLAGAYLVNDAFVRWMGWKEPLGKQIEFFGRRGKVIGVVRDFHFASLHQPVSPLIIMYQQRSPEKLLLKTGAGGLLASLAQLQPIWHELLPDYPFEYHSLEDHLAGQYGQEQRAGALFHWGATITIGVACLGLLGMASLSGRRRTKEIGIRKVLGATTGSIVFLLLRGFLLRVLPGILLALPLAWYLGRRWLESFAYRIPSFGSSLAIAAGIAFLLALLITLYHGLRTSQVNPVITIRSE